jgi:hypothetical protein
VYKQGQREGTEIKINAPTPDTVVRLRAVCVSQDLRVLTHALSVQKRWQDLGYNPVERTYDFHGGDALVTPPLTDPTHRLVWEE